jgi:hypothetical protein
MRIACTLPMSTLDDLIPVHRAAKLLGLTSTGGRKLFDRLGHTVMIGGIGFVSRTKTEEVRRAREEIRRLHQQMRGGAHD